MLSNSEIDFLGTREAKIYANDPSIEAMTTLKTAGEKNDVAALVEVMNNKEVNLLGDPLLFQYKDDLLRNSYLSAL